MIRFERALPLFVVGALASLASAYSGGPPTRRTGAPGEQTCLSANCHVGERFDDSPTVELDLDGPREYDPGGPRQRWTLRIGDAARAYGLQLSVRRADRPLHPAGRLFPVEGSTTAVVCEDDSIPKAGCPEVSPLEFFHHTEPRRQGVFEVDWTPPRDAIGDLLVYVAANASVAGQRNSRIHLRAFRIPPRRDDVTVFNAASLLPTFSPGAWISIFGSGLAPAALAWQPGGDVPRSLGGVRVTVGGREAGIGFAGPGQINALAPEGVELGPARVEVIRDGAPTLAGQGWLERVSPALFDASRLIRARAGEIVSLNGTGFGPTNPPVPWGSAFEGEARCVLPVVVRAGDAQANLRFAGLVAPGVYRIDFAMPPVPAGIHDLVVSVDGWKAPAGRISSAE